MKEYKNALRLVNYFKDKYIYSKRIQVKKRIPTYSRKVRWALEDDVANYVSVRALENDIYYEFNIETITRKYKVPLVLTKTRIRFGAAPRCGSVREFENFFNKFPNEYDEDLNLPYVDTTGGNYIGIFNLDESKRRQYPYLQQKYEEILDIIEDHPIADYFNWGANEIIKNKFLFEVSLGENFIEFSLRLSYRTCYYSRIVGIF